MVLTYCYYPCMTLYAWFSGVDSKSRFPLRRKRSRKRPRNKTNTASDSCVSMEAFSARVSAPVFDDLCVHLDLPRVYKCEMVSFQLMLTKNRAETPILYRSFFPRAETREWKRFNGKGSMCFCASEVSARGNAGVSAAMESGTKRSDICSALFRLFNFILCSMIYITPY